MTTAQLRELATQRGIELPKRMPADVAATREVLLAALEAAGVALLTQDEVLALTVPSSRRAEPTPPPGSPRSGKLSPRSLSAKLESVATTPGECWGSHRPHAHLSTRNLVNALLCALAVLPSIMLSEAMLRGCPELAPKPLPPTRGCRLTWGGCSSGCVAQLGGWTGVRCVPPGGGTAAGSGTEDDPAAAAVAALCDLAARSPVWWVQLLFFANVTVGFWLVGLLQRSFWLIDPYWTLLPPLIGVWYEGPTHARAACCLRGRVRSHRTACALASQVPLPRRGGCARRPSA